MTTPGIYAISAHAYQYDGSNGQAIATWLSDWCSTHPGQFQTLSSWSEAGGILSLVIANNLSSPLSIGTGEFVVVANSAIGQATQADLDLIYHQIA